MCIAVLWDTDLSCDAVASIACLAQVSEPLLLAVILLCDNQSLLERKYLHLHCWIIYLSSCVSRTFIGARVDYSISQPFKGFPVSDLFTGYQP